MGNVLQVDGVNIEDIPVINRPSYFLVNNYGREGYLSILEPMENFRKSEEAVMEAKKYKSVMELVKAFKAVAPTGSTENGYNRKDIANIKFMGFKWAWRSNHRSFYGAIKVGYELLPLIARWIVLTGAVGSIDNKSKDYLPARYNGGTGKGFGGSDVEQPEVDEYGCPVVTEVDKVGIFPVKLTKPGGILRAAQMTNVPASVLSHMDFLLGREPFMGMLEKLGDVASKYVAEIEVRGEPKYIGVVYGSGKLPEWAFVLMSRGDKNIMVSVVEVIAKSLEEAEEKVRLYSTVCEGEAESALSKKLNKKG